MALYFFFWTDKNVAAIENFPDKLIWEILFMGIFLQTFGASFLTLWLVSTSVTISSALTIST